MNRRKAIAALATLPMAGGVIKAIEKEPMPLFAVLEVPQHVSREVGDHIQSEWKRMFDGHPPFKLLIIGAGGKLTLATNEGMQAPGILERSI